MRDLFEFFQVFSTLATVVGIVFVLALHVILAQAVANDVDKLHTSGRRPRFLGSAGWPFAALVLGLVTVAFYWAVHYSTLRDVAHDLPLESRRH